MRKLAAAFHRQRQPYLTATDTTLRTCSAFRPKVTRYRSAAAGDRTEANLQISFRTLLYFESIPREISLCAKCIKIPTILKIKEKYTRCFTLNEQA